MRMNNWLQGQDPEPPCLTAWDSWLPRKLGECVSTQHERRYLKIAWVSQDADYLYFQPMLSRPPAVITFTMPPSEPTPTLSSTEYLSVRSMPAVALIGLTWAVRRAQTWFGRPQNRSMRILCKPNKVVTHIIHNVIVNFDVSGIRVAQPSQPKQTLAL